VTKRGGPASSSSPGPEAFLAEADPRIDEFGTWFSAKGQPPLARLEWELLRAFLFWQQQKGEERCTAERD